MNGSTTAERGGAARLIAGTDEARRLAGDRRPALVFSRDGQSCLWANPAAGALLGAESFAELTARPWSPTLSRALCALAATVPPAGALARLPLAGGATAPVSLCRASLIRLPDGKRGLLVVASETVRGELAAPETFRPAEPEPEESRPMPAEPPAPAADAGPKDPPGDPLDIARAEPALPEEPLATASPLPPAAQDEEADFAALDQRLRDRFGLEPRSDPAIAADAGKRPSPEDRPERGAEVPEAGEPEGASISAGRVERRLDRKPVRFLWQTDAAHRVLFMSPGLAQVVGRNAEIVGEALEDAAERLRLDPAGRIVAALQRRDTWSGEIAWWPVEGSQVRVPAELTALPVFGPDRSFQGYRGFGVLRPAEALMPAAFEARFGKPPRPLADQLPPYEEAATTAPANVVPIRAELDKISEFARLTPQERNTFEEIAAALRDRIVAGRDERNGEAASRAAPNSGGNGDRGASVRPLFTDRRRPARTGPGAGPAGGTAIGETQREARSRPAGPAAPPQRPASKLPQPEAADAPQKLPASPKAPAAGTAEPPALQAAPLPGAGEPGSDAGRRASELAAILDTATDGVLVVDGDGMIESVNASAEALFGLDAAELAGTSFLDLLLADSRGIALDYLNGLRDNGVASLLNEGREVEATSGAGTLPLFMTMGRLGGDDGERFCAVLRDITHWKRAEAELIAARRAAEHASNQKSDFLARVSHEIRTPLNAIIGFAEVMLEEQFGPIENDRYREYLRDIRTSGEHVVSLVNDLLDISKIEAGKLELNFAAVPLNDLLRECIGLMQPQAGRARVVIRSSLARDVPGIVADERTLRQIILNLLSNSVKYTGPGGQVIASTSLAESGEAVLRIRDTGAGMSEEELVRAMEPFRQLSTSAIGDRNSTGLGLPLTKALVEANRAAFSIRSTPGEGTMVQVTFPPTRVLSE